MSGHHHHHHSHDSGTRNISAAFFINLAFSIIEVLGGLWTNSLAVLSDALHDLGDALSLGIAWYFQRISARKSDEHFTYGYRRFSLLGAIINAIILFAGSVIIIIEAIPRVIHPQQPDAKGMILLAVLGILFNGAAMLKLRKGNSLNEEMVALHLWEDVLGWFAVLIGSVVMVFFDVPELDPILSILIALYILYNVFKGMRKSIKIILQGMPEAVDFNNVELALDSVEGICDIHDLHIWSLDGRYNVMSLHVVIREGLLAEDEMDIKSKIRALMQRENIDHVTIELEHTDEECLFKNSN